MVESPILSDAQTFAAEFPFPGQGMRKRNKAKTTEKVQERGFKILHQSKYCAQITPECPDTDFSFPYCGSQQTLTLA